MIVSTVDGRLRARANRLKSMKISESIKTRIEALPGVTGVRTNPGAACLVVNFHAESVDSELLEDEIVKICTPTRQGKKGAAKNKLSRRLNQANKVGMTGTLAASLAYGYLGKKRLHIQYGTAFVALAGLHMLTYSHTLLR
jgi:hypothetical protein